MKNIENITDEIIDDEEYFDYIDYFEDSSMIDDEETIMYIDDSEDDRFEIA